MLLLIVAVPVKDMIACFYRVIYYMAYDLSGRIVQGQPDGIVNRQVDM